MPAWIAIRASAVMAIAGGAGTLLLAGAMVAAMLFAPMRDAAALPPAALRVIGVLVGVVFASAGAWGIATGAGIFRRRPWARISMVIAGCLLVFFGVTGFLTVLFVPLQVDATVDRRAADFVVYAMRWFYAVQAVVGLWWLVLFNRRGAKEYFAVEAPAAAHARPLSISVVGWLLLTGAVVTALAAVLRAPGLFFGILVTGWAAAAVYTACAAAQLYLGSGLLQLENGARIAAIFWFVLAAASGAVSAASPGFDGHILALHDGLQSYFRVTLPDIGIHWAAGVAGALAVLAPVWFLARRRAAFR